MTPTDALQELPTLLDLEACAFVDFLSTLGSLRYTGTVTLHVLNGQPQKATLGPPLLVTFAEHPANKLTIRVAASPPGT